MQLIHELNREGATIAVITHDNEIADALPRQVKIRDGVVVADTRPADGVRSAPLRELR
jgi:putative ABC transport system ATP-binding protein